MNLPTVKDFKYVEFEGTFVVWLAELNRFIQLMEPAFFVFEAWARGKEPADIAGECASLYDLTPEEALQFTLEITGEMEKLYHSAPSLSLSVPESLSPSVSPSLSLSVPESPSPSVPPSLRPSVPESPSPSVRSCTIGGKTIHFKYGDEELEATFRPLFRQFETGQDKVEVEDEVEVEEDNENQKENENQDPNENQNQSKVEDHGEKDAGSGKPESYTLDLFRKEGSYWFRTNGENEQSFPEAGFEHFHGAVYMELLYILYGKKQEDWMGVFHASAVSRGDEALLFVAASGSGKSTLAAVMMAHGYNLISDDLVPVAFGQPEVYPLPTAISVKQSAIPYLKSWFPALCEDKIALKDEEEGVEAFLPVAEAQGHLTPARAKAILFVRYDPLAEYRLTKESNLKMMNDFLKQSWIPARPEAAEAFLQWYLKLPVYSLVYSDAEKAAKEVAEVLYGSCGIIEHHDQAVGS